VWPTNRRNPAIWKNHRGLFAQYDLMKINVYLPPRNPIKKNEGN
jgi:hypothetical protein